MSNSSGITAPTAAQSTIRRRTTRLSTAPRRPRLTLTARFPTRYMKRPLTFSSALKQMHMPTDSTRAMLLRTIMRPIFTIMRTPIMTENIRISIGDSIATALLLHLKRETPFPLSRHSTDLITTSIRAAGSAHSRTRTAISSPLQARPPWLTT